MKKPTPNRLKFVRLKFGWNQRQVAKLAGVDYRIYRRYENLNP